MRRSLLALVALFVAVCVVCLYAAVAWVATSKLNSNGFDICSTTCTESYTVGASSTALVLYWGDDNRSNVLSTATWNGTSMTCSAAGFSALNELGNCYILSPTTGTHNIVVTTNNAADMFMSASDFSGTSTSGVDSCNGSTQNGSGSGTNVSCTVNVANSWPIINVYSGAGSAFVCNSGPCTVRTSGYALQYGAIDSGADIASGSYTANISANACCGINAYIPFALNPAGGGSSAPIINLPRVGIGIFLQLPWTAQITRAHSQILQHPRRARVL